MKERISEKELRAMSNQELLELMDTLLEQPEDQVDMELFAAAQDLLDRWAPIDIPMDPHSAWEEHLERNRALLEGTDEKEPPGDAPPIREPPSAGRRHSVGFRVFRGLAAALVLVLGLNAVAAVAAGENPLRHALDLGEQLVRGITYGPSGALAIQAEVEGYRSLDEALAATGNGDAMQLTWIPTAFFLSNVQVYLIEGSGGTQYDYWCSYESQGEASLLYHIEAVPQGTGIYVREKNPGSAYFTSNGTEFELLENNGVRQAFWYDGSYNYMLAGAVSERQMEQMLRSVK